MHVLHSMFCKICVCIYVQIICIIVSWLLQAKIKIPACGNVLILCVQCMLNYLCVPAISHTLQDQARAALSTHGWDVERAIDSIFS